MTYHLVWTYDSAQPAIEVFQDPNVLAIEKATPRTVYIVMAEGIAAFPTSIGDEPRRCHVRFIQNNTKTDLFDESIVTLIRNRFGSVVTNFAQQSDAATTAEALLEPVVLRNHNDNMAEIPFWLNPDLEGNPEGHAPPETRARLIESTWDYAHLEYGERDIYIRSEDFDDAPLDDPNALEAFSSGTPFTTRLTADTPYWLDRNEADEGHIGAWSGLVPPGSKGTLYSRSGNAALVNFNNGPEQVFVRTADITHNSQEETPAPYRYALLTKED